MLESMPKMTIQEMGQTHSIMRAVDLWADGGDMRSFAGGDPMPPSSSLERASILAFDVARLDDPGRGHGPGSRNDLLELMGNGLRIAIVDEREGGNDGRSDVDRARLILTSMAMILAARDQADGLEPAQLENPALEAMRQRSGLEASALDRKDAHALGVGMTDMVHGEEANRQIREALSRALKPAEFSLVEDRLRMADATWPQVEPRDPPRAVSAAKGPEQAVLPAEAAMARLGREGR